MNPPLCNELPPEALAVLAHARAHETTFEGRRTVWHAWGEGEPVVLLHGGSGSWTHWIRNIDTLVAGGRQVWAPDLPGCGDSDQPATGEDADGLVAPLLAGLRTLLGPRPFDLVGFSFGSLTAGLIAAERPAGLRRLVVVGAPVLDLGGMPVKLSEWRHLSTAQEQAVVHRANLAALMLFRPEAITPAVVAIHAANLARDRLRRRRLALTDALARAIEKVRVPVTAIYGFEDAIYRGITDRLRATVEALPNVREFVAIEAAGHWVQYEAPAAFDDALRRALNAPLPG
jgi:2-hydroxy-6-oxonona-2,4-dienedioate hydrolase